MHNHPGEMGTCDLGTACPHNSHNHASSLSHSKTRMIIKEGALRSRTKLPKVDVIMIRAENLEKGIKPAVGSSPQHEANRVFMSIAYAGK